jgi:hypothetical protein
MPRSIPPELQVRAAETFRIRSTRQIITRGQILDRENELVTKYPQHFETLPMRLKAQ